MNDYLSIHYKVGHACFGQGNKIFSGVFILAMLGVQKSSAVLMQHSQYLNLKSKTEGCDVHNYCK